MFFVLFVSCQITCNQVQNITAFGVLSPFCLVVGLNRANRKSSLTHNIIIIIFYALRILNRIKTQVYKVWSSKLEHLTKVIVKLASF